MCATGADRSGQQQAKSSLNRIENKQAQAQGSLNRIEDDVTQLSVEKRRKVFRPIDPRIRQETERRLRETFSKHQGVGPRVKIGYLVGDGNRQRAAEEIFAMCEAASIPSGLRRTMMTTETEPLNLYCHPESQQLAKDFMAALGLVLKNQSIAGHSNENHDRSEIVLSLIGKPEFDENGAVEFK